jgi:predicted RNA-binding Zn-ribbon protein involved in translation (DUF1610 family)
MSKRKLDKIKANDIIRSTKCSQTSFTTQKEVNEMDRREERKRERRLKLEEKKGGFRCCNCGQWVPFSEFMGTKHRNHCPFCLWSKHVDLKKPGDRKAECQTGMKPIGLTFKHEGVDKYGRLRSGELMLIHECVNCGKVSINRIAADDNTEAILRVFKESQELPPEKKNRLEHSGIEVLSDERREEVLTQLFGKDFRKA